MAAHMAANLPADLRGPAIAPRRATGEATPCRGPAPVHRGPGDIASCAADAASHAGDAGLPTAALPAIVRGADGRRRAGGGAGSIRRGTLAVALARRLDRPLVACLERRDHAARQVGTSRRARRAPGRLVVRRPRAAAAASCSSTTSTRRARRSTPPHARSRARARPSSRRSATPGRCDRRERQRRQVRGVDSPRTDHLARQSRTRSRRSDTSTSRRVEFVGLYAYQLDPGARTDDRFRPAPAPHPLPLTFTRARAEVPTPGLARQRRRGESAQGRRGESRVGWRGETARVAPRRTARRAARRTAPNRRGYAIARPASSAHSSAAR